PEAKTLSHSQGVQLIHHRGPEAYQLVPMPDQLSNITVGSRRHPDPRKTILDQQVENVQSIPGVRLLFAHHRRADLRRTAKPKFMPILTEHLFEPLRGDGGFYPDAA